MTITDPRDAERVKNERKKKVAVLVSGRGTNLQALIDAAKAPDYPAEIVLVVSNNPSAGGLKRAAAAAIPAEAIDHRAFGKGADARRAFDQAVSRRLRDASADLVCLAGFMRILSSEFVEEWRERIINIHPSLLPAYKGLDVHERMIADGVKIAGCTVHYVVADMDAGPIIGQSAVPVAGSDTPETLAAKILAAEHHLYPECLRLAASGKAPVAPDGVVRLAPAAIAADAVLHNPPPVAPTIASRPTD